MERAGRDAPETNATGKRFGCAPDCAVDVDEVPGVTDAAWDLWRTPSLGGLGGYDVSYVRSRADLSTGGGNRFGYDLVRYAYNWFVRDGLGAEVDLSALPYGRGFRQACVRYGLEPDATLASGGEDYELLFSVPPEHADPTKWSKRLGVRVSRVGQVVSSPGVRGLDPGGWRHF